MFPTPVHDEAEVCTVGRHMAGEKKEQEAGD